MFEFSSKINEVIQECIDMGSGSIKTPKYNLKAEWVTKDDYDIVALYIYSPQSGRVCYVDYIEETKVYN